MSTIKVKRLTAKELLDRIHAELAVPEPDWGKIIDLLAEFVKLFVPTEFHQFVDIVADLLKRLVAGSTIIVE